MTRWTPEAKQVLGDIQGHVCNRFALDPRKWNKEPSAEELRPVSEWLAGLEGNTSRGAAARIRQEYREMLRDNPAPTEFDSPAWHMVAAGLCNRVEEAADSLGIEIPERPLFGTLPIGRLNAFALRSKRRVLTLFNVGLFDVLNAVSKLVSLVFPIESATGERAAFAVGSEQFSEQLLSKPGIKHRFVELFRAYVVDGDVSFSPRYRLGKDRLHLQQILLHSSEVFVVAHEYGHVIHRHLSGAKAQATALAEKEVSELRYDWLQEYEADARGFELMIEAMRSYDVYIPASVVGAGLFFATSQMLERIVHGLQSGSFELGEPNTRSSHPPPLARQLHLEDSLASLPLEQANQCKLWSGIPFEVLTMLFALTRAEWEAMYERGERPAQIWDL